MQSAVSRCISLFLFVSLLLLSKTQVCFVQLCVHDVTPVNSHHFCKTPLMFLIDSINGGLDKPSSGENCLPLLLINFCSMVANVYDNSPAIRFLCMFNLYLMSTIVNHLFLFLAHRMNNINCDDSVVGQIHHQVYFMA